MPARVTFVPAARLKPAADVAFAEHAAAIAAILPRAEVEHVGATSIPGALTKGDLDLLVRVEPHAFAEAVAALRDRYGVHQPENWSDSYASFAWEGESPLPVGVQLVVAGSRDDLMFGRLQALLVANPDALGRLNALKRSFEGRDYEEYTEAKARLIGSLIGG